MKKLVYSALFLLAGCTSQLTKPVDRAQVADQIASLHQWAAQELHTAQFDLKSYAAPTVINDTLTIYIEGDGLAWLTRSQPSFDPTPVTPVALQLAVQHAGEGNVAYLARPCQFTGGRQARNCEIRHWTGSRFSNEVIDASNQAVEALKSRFNAKHIQLVGYSGGGAVAALVASRRQDVTSLVTVAGNLDTKAWADTLRITPLTDSLNPADAASQLTHIKQMHFAGGRDRSVPFVVAESFAVKTAPPAPVRVIPQADHHCCWSLDWPSLQLQAPLR